MFRLVMLSLALCGALALAAPVAAPVVDTADAAAKKRGCATKKTKKARAQCQRLRKTGKYRKGQVCALSAKKQQEYSRYGFFCLDISANQDGSLTYLEDLE